MYIEGVLFKNTFGPLNTFRMRIAHDPYLMLDRRGEIVDLSKKLMYFTNKAGGALGANGYWYLDGERVGANRLEVVRYLVKNTDVATKLETAIQAHFIEATSFMNLIDEPAAAETDVEQDEEAEEDDE